MNTIQVVNNGRRLFRKHGYFYILNLGTIYFGMGSFLNHVIDNINILLVNLPDTL